MGTKSAPQDEWWAQSLLLRMSGVHKVSFSGSVVGTKSALQDEWWAQSLLLRVSGGHKVCSSGSVVGTMSATPQNMNMKLNQ